MGKERVGEERDGEGKGWQGWGGEGLSFYYILKGVEGLS